MKFNKRKFSFLYRGFILIVLCMIIGVAVATKYLSYTQPMYESMAKIRLADLQDGTAGNNLFKDLDVFATKNELAAEIEVVKSQVLIDKVASKLDFSMKLSRVGSIKTQEIYKAQPFSVKHTLESKNSTDVHIDVKVLNKSKYKISLQSFSKVGKFGEILNIPDYGSIELALNEKEVNKRSNSYLIDNFSIQLIHPNNLYAEIYKNLDVVLVDKEVPVMKIIYKSAVPEKAAIFVNALAQTYIEDFIETKYKTAETTSDFLDNQISQVNKKLKGTESDIQNYRDAKNVINVVQETETDLRKIAQMKIQKTNVKMSLDAIKDLNGYVQNGKDNFLELAPNFEAYTDLLSTELIKKIKALQEEKTDLLMTYSSNHPRVTAVNEKINQKKDYIVEAIGNTKDNLESKYNNLSMDILDAEKVFIGLPEKERILHTLDRNFSLQEQSYVFLNQKRIEAEIAKSANISFHRIITSAFVPKRPVSPNRPIIIIVFAILGGGGAMLIIFLVHLLKGKVNDISTIEKNSDIPILAQAPHLKANEIDFFFNRETLRLQLKGSLVKGSSIAFTSPRNNHGASFQARNFGAALERQGVKVNYLQIEDKPSKHQIGFEYISYNDIKNYSSDQLLSLVSPKSKDEITIVINESLKSNKLSTIIMSLVDINLFVLDSRKTLASEISTVTLASEENTFKNFNFILNNDGYIPSIFKEGRLILRKTIIKIKSIRNDVA